MDRSTRTLEASIVLALCGVLAGCQTTAGGATSKADLIADRNETIAGSCAFLPDSPRPTWVTTRPDTEDYVGVGQAGTSEGPETQIRAAEDRARNNLASEVKVKIQEQLIQNVCEGQCGEEE